ncbi:hypothetical protein LZG04_26380 [Saccharothrix sp. S26]|uniref:hypothetical protein n=1 Tax=Saccharothrix sp. S26 TaxID=2907215 RepID=UPI001F304DA4|nr:hypothetical protein [Saccharothrix sp. S26]MCE6998298.1 hypothetical protein [Saccharothrix sp. S26]
MASPSSEFDPARRVQLCSSTRSGVAVVGAMRSAAVDTARDEHPPTVTAAR